MLGFDWDDANRAHIARHGISVAEAEEASSSEATLDLGFDIVDGELPFEHIESTKAGRILKLVTTDRDELVRIVTAFDVSPAMKKFYLKMMVIQR